MIPMVFFPVMDGNEYSVVRREEREELTEAELEELTRKAEAGDALSQLLLGYHYCDEAEKKLALFQSLPSGSPNLKGAAVMWDKNPITDAVNEDRRRAFLWFERAAGLGSVEALYELSVCYERGAGTPSFPEKARKLLEQAANAGYMPAQYDFGMLYLYGKTNTAGVKEFPKDESLAVKWLLKAAEQGDSLAQYQLGECFEVGIGVEANEETAIAWYEKSAERGNELAYQALERLKEE